MNVTALYLITAVFFTTSAFGGDLLSFKEEKNPGFFRMYLEPTRMKMDFSENGKDVKSTMIFVKEKQEVTAIDHGSKKFTVLDKPTIERMSAKLGSSMAKMDEMMKKMPPEMRKMMKEKMGAMGGGGDKDLPVEVKKAGSGETVGRWKATRYEVLRGKNVVSETWTVPMKEVNVDEKNFAVLQGMSALYAGIGKELKGVMSQAGAVDMQTWKKMEGFPVKTLSRARKGGHAYVLEKSEKKNLDDSEFAAPSDYKKQEIGKL